MKHFRFSMLLAYFALKKNSKRALIAINAGIFLSIFACTSAIITLFIENKVSKLEFEHLEYSSTKRYLERSLKEIPNYSNQLIQNRNMEYTSERFLDFIGLTEFGKIIQSNNDYQMLALYESTYILEDLGDDINYFDEIFDINFLPKEEGEKINKILANIKKKMKSIEKNKTKQSLFKKIIYERTWDDLFDEIQDSYKKEKKGTYDLTSGKYYQQFEDADDLVVLFIELFDFSFYYVSILIENFDEDLNKINDDIINYSKMEKNLILLAFLFQLSVFMIVQFFEISSINFNLKRKIKLLRR